MLDRIQLEQHGIIFCKLLIGLFAVGTVRGYLALLDRGRRQSCRDAFRAVIIQFAAFCACCTLKFVILATAKTPAAPHAPLERTAIVFAGLTLVCLCLIIVIGGDFSVRAASSQ